MTNLINLQTNWIEKKAKLKQRYAILTDNDLLLVEGKEEELVGRLQQIVGGSKSDLIKIIAEI